ncbi:MAG: hypothetical protein LBC02_11950 [Planctomycetaceae bacterium]|jgi:hypothetical protein|nr:hypothetical protein [Planctomycetaceae bacterium]
MNDELEKEMSEFFDKVSVSISKLMLEQMEVSEDFYRCVGDSDTRGNYILYLYLCPSLEAWVKQKTGLEKISYAESFVDTVVVAWRLHRIYYTVDESGKFLLFRRQDLEDFIKSREH